MKEEICFPLEELIYLIDYEKECCKKEDGKLKFLENVQELNDKYRYIIKYCAKKLEINDFTDGESKDIIKNHVTHDVGLIDNYYIGGAYYPALKRVSLNPNYKDDDLVGSASHEFVHYLIYNKIYSLAEVISGLLPFQKCREKCESVPTLISFDAVYGFTDSRFHESYIEDNLGKIASVHKYYASKYGKNCMEFNEKTGKSLTYFNLEGVSERCYYIGFAKARLLQKRGYKLRDIAKMDFGKVKIVEK